jgi:hypothetical protein
MGLIVKLIRKWKNCVVDLNIDMMIMLIIIIIIITMGAKLLVGGSNLSPAHSVL